MSPYRTCVIIGLADCVRFLNFEVQWHCHKSSNVLTSKKKILETTILEPDCQLKATGDL